MSEVSLHKGVWTKENKNVWRLTTSSHVFEFSRRPADHEHLVITLQPQDSSVLEENAPKLDDELKPGVYDWAVKRMPDERNIVITHVTRLRNKTDRGDRRPGTLTQNTTSAAQHVALNKALLRVAMLNFQTHPERYWLNPFVDHLVTQIPRIK